MDIYDQHGPATHAARAAAWGAWGEIDTHVIAHLINPSFMGGPSWPATRQAHLIVRREDAMLVASDGLADPIEWNDAPPGNGFEVEVYGIGDRVPNDTVMGVSQSWLGQMVMRLSGIVASNRMGFVRQLEENGTLSVAFPGSYVPDDRFLDSDGNPVMILGLVDEELPASVEGPLSTIRLVNGKLLTGAEADFCVQGGMGSGDARAELARRFAEQGGVLRSWDARESVV